MPHPAVLACYVMVGYSLAGYGHLDHVLHKQLPSDTFVIQLQCTCRNYIGNWSHEYHSIMDIVFHCNVVQDKKFMQYWNAC